MSTENEQKMTSRIESHPAATLFPLLDDAATARLADDIKANGLRVPIVLLGGKVLDGRNRLAACALAGVAPRFVEHIDGDPWRAVWSLNAERRQIEDKVRLALIGKRMVEGSDGWRAAQMEAEERARRAQSDAKKGNQNARRDPINVPSREGTLIRDRSESSRANEEPARLAAELGVSRSTAERAIELERKAPAAAAAVERGEVQGSKALREVKQAEARGRVEAQAQAAPERAMVTCQDAVDFLAELANNSVDLLLTDPPYSTDVDNIGSFARWLARAVPKLKLTGRAYICIGAYPDEILAYLTVIQDLLGTDRTQLLVWTYRNTLGPAPRETYKQNWQAILYLRASGCGPLDVPVMTEQFSVQDINAPDGRLGNRYHAWQKPDELAERFIRHATKPGDLVVDPFAGTGTFLLAAARLGRRAMGCDISDENLKIAEKRGCLLA